MVAKLFCYVYVVLLCAGSLEQLGVLSYVASILGDFPPLLRYVRTDVANLLC